ncbi:DUF6421 family protein [Acidothermaceae bacterium B102]|nr:DUF6421 family protein [Acidothermaceae bacterium B102]
MKILANVLFDESHANAWSIRPGMPERMNPANPGDASYQQAAELLRHRGHDVTPQVEGHFTDEVLAPYDVLVLAHPSEPAWERTTWLGSPLLTADEIDVVERWVRGGGGLVVLGECDQDKYGNNLNDLLARFGVRIITTTVQDLHNHQGVATWVLGELVPHPILADEDVLAGVSGACFYRAGVIEAADAQVLARTSRTADPAGLPLAVTVEPDAGRVAVFADSDLFGDDSIADYSQSELWANTVAWAAGGRMDGRAVDTRSADVADDPAWRALKASVSALRSGQAKDGSVDADLMDASAAADLVAQIVACTRQLAARFPYDEGYLTQVCTDLERWAADGFGVPDFLDSLLQFRPDLQRVDGREHLVLFPMYTQNGNPNRNFEALLIRVMWPSWLAEVEQGGYDNPMFVPITFIDFTEGYDTHSAVLFPETVAVREVPRFSWGGIFCDREAARFRTVSTAAAETLRLAVPPDAARLLGNQDLAQGTFALWDLVHDRTHSHGDLPFDPFMIKQRMPFWMYALEELRCDLNAFRSTLALEADGQAHARLVRFAIVFDRLFRFPITGNRVRNYDGLGGQLLFSYLHRAGVLHWTDNALSLDWVRLPGAVVDLCDEVERLYHDGIDRSKVGHWMAAHEFVSRYVPAHPASVWAQGITALPHQEEPRKMVDEVLPDEFPLNVFYEALKRKLGDVVESAAGITGAAA